MNKQDYIDNRPELKARLPAVLDVGGHNKESESEVRDMPKYSNKLLGLIEDLAVIADDAIKVEGVLGIRIEKDTYPAEVHIRSREMEVLKGLSDREVKVEDHSDKYFQESMIFFDEVKVFCLIGKPTTEVDINVVPAELAI